MLSQLTIILEVSFLFGIVQTAAFFIMWTPTHSPLPHPALCGKDLLSSEKRGRGRRTFYVFSSRQYCCVNDQQGAPFHHWGLYFCSRSSPSPFAEPALFSLLFSSKGPDTLGPGGRQGWESRGWDSHPISGPQAALLKRLGSFGASFFEPMATGHGASLHQQRELFNHHHRH